MNLALGCLAGALAAWPAASAIPVHRAGRLQRRPMPRRRVPPEALVVGGVWCVAVLVSTPVVAALAAAGAAAVVRVWRRRAADRAEQDRVRALAEALGVLAAELRAGRPAPEATRTAAACCAHPVVADAVVHLLSADGRPGMDQDLVGPSGTDGDIALSRVAAAAAVSARTGCSLAAVVTAAEDDLRARLQTAADLRAAVAGPRASAVVLAGLPVLGLLMGAGVGADPWRVLTTTPAGTGLLIAGAGLEAAGLAWSGRLLRRAARA